MYSVRTSKDYNPVSDPKTASQDLIFQQALGLAGVG